MFVLFLFILYTTTYTTRAQDLPTLYEYYTDNGINSGLSDSQPYFTLNDKNITLFSGALHYYRNPPEQWRDRLRKFRAAGLNAVETYVPWNLNEPERGKFDFGHGGTDFEKYLDIELFIKTAQEEDLFVLVRPGPYICAEFEFGGMPSWLLRNDGIEVRTSDPVFIKAVDEYFKHLLKILEPLQFTKGGAIIAFQIENEYASACGSCDQEYLKDLVKMFKSNGIVELLYTADGPSLGFNGTLPELLYTANVGGKVTDQLTIVQKYQPNKPLMVMECYPGWFDHWAETHNTRSPEQFTAYFEEILAFGTNTSVNLYMMIGGTNYGFLNGANGENMDYKPTTTSYDYDAPLSENGDYGNKYKEVEKYIYIYNGIETKLPEKPKLADRIVYDSIKITGQLSVEALIMASDQGITNKSTIPMELLPINNGNGQSYGYIVYKKEHLNIPANGTLKIGGRVTDAVFVLINGKLINKVFSAQNDLNGFGYWRAENSSIKLSNEEELEDATLELIVVNLGRNNYGRLNQFNQKKGIWQGNVSINEQILEDWQLIPLEFKSAWTKSLTGWEKPTFPKGPTLYRTELEISGEPADTYLDMSKWNMGIVIVNNFVLARHWKIGPQQAAYLPYGCLHSGTNEILIFEHFEPAQEVSFTKNQIYKTMQ